MDSQYKHLIKEYLTPDEYVIWDGRPGKEHLLTKQDVFLLPFGIIWNLFCIIWESIVLLAPTDIIAKLWGIPFVCIGLYLTPGRFILKTYKRRKTVYAITNKRVFFIRNNQIQTLDYHTHLTRKITWHPDGFGNIRFYKPAPEPDELIGFYTSIQLAGLPSYELENIPDVARVLRILTETDAD